MMITKWCGHCKKEKPLEVFSSNKSRPDGKSHQCKECHNKWARDRYEANRERLAANTRNHYRGKRATVDALKDVPCADCGNRYPPYVMDFDHLGDKEFGIAQGLRSLALDRILIEIQKCDVVCSNCHRIRTHNRRLEEAVS